MNITRHKLQRAVESKIISEPQADALFNFLKQLPTSSPAYNFTNVLYYFGGMLAIGAMTLFMNLGWETFGGWGIFVLSLLYALVGLCLSSIFHQRQLSIPAAICATFVTCLTPLAIYGLQLGMGWWPDQSVYRGYHYYIQWHWMFMELGTLIVGVILAWIYRYPFMVMPIAVTLWYMSMDITAMLTGGALDFALSAQVSMYFGLLIIFIAIFVDVRSRHSADFAFWLYFFGVMAFWFGLSSHYSDSGLQRFIYCCVNLILIGAGVLLVRRVFVVFGALGVTLYLGELSWTLFKDSLIFPLALTLIGFFIIFLGIVWQKHEKRLTLQMRLMLPKPLQELLVERDNA